MSQWASGFPFVLDFYPSEGLSLQPGTFGCLLWNVYNVPEYGRSAEKNKAKLANYMNFFLRLQVLLVYCYLEKYLELDLLPCPQIFSLTLSILQRSKMQC